MSGGDDRGRMRGFIELKTNVVSAAARKKHCLLLVEACLATYFRGWVLNCGVTLLLNIVCVPPKPEMVSLHREEEQREQGGLYGETSSCRYCGAILCTH